MSKWRIRKIGGYFRIITHEDGILAARASTVAAAMNGIGKIERRRQLRRLQAI